MEIRSLAGVGFDTVYEAFGRAFADYEIQLDAAQLRAMLTRRGYCPELSFAAFEDGGIVSFTLNGTGMFYGVKTAYDTGTGTLKEWRGQGLATAIFDHSAPNLKKAGIVQYVLEVLRHNETAAKVYRNIGFDVTRELECFGQSVAEVRRGGGTADYEVRPAEVATLGNVEVFWDFTPSWQNSLESAKRAVLPCLGAFDGDGKLVGYCIFDPESGDVAQLAVDRNHRRKGIATRLLDEMLKLNRHDRVKVLNIDSRRPGTGLFLASRGIVPTVRQFEMAKKL